MIRGRKHLENKHVDNLIPDHELSLDFKLVNSFSGERYNGKVRSLPSTGHPFSERTIKDSFKKLQIYKI